MNDTPNPYDSPHEKSTDAPPPAKGASWKVWLGTLVVLGAIVFFCLLPAFSRNAGVRNAARRMQSQSNLKMIGLALHNYHDTYGSLPPAVVTDAKGRKLYSWRVLLLPYLEQNALYERFDLSQPWDSEHNRPLVEQMPDVFRSPFPDSTDRDRKTPYLALVDAKDEQTAMLPARGRSFDEITDGLSNTAVVVDDPAHPLPWTAPHDRDPWDLLGRATFDETDLHGIQLLLADGSVHKFSDTGRPLLVGLMFCNDGRTPEDDEVPHDE